MKNLILEKGKLPPQALELEDAVLGALMVDKRGIEDIDFLEDRRVEEFNAWWGQFEQAFCQHYNLPHWKLTDMQGVYPFGTLEQINELDMKLQTGAIPYKIKL